MRVVNMTPHAVVLMDADGKVIHEFAPSGQLIRLSTKTVPAFELNFDENEDAFLIPITRTEFGEPEGLPEYQDGTYYITSALVKGALPDRKDLLVPNEAVRDEQGRIVGCRSLGC